MAFASVGALISEANKTSLSSWTTTATLTNALAAGQLGVIILTSDNADAGSDVQPMRHYLTDSVGNEWRCAGEFVNTQSASPAGAEVSVWTCVATTTLPTNGTFTAVFRGGPWTAKAITGWVFSLGGAAVSVEAINVQSNDAADAGSISISSLTSTEYLWVRGIARESDSTAFTPTASYTAFTAVATSGSTADTNMGACGEWRILTATGDTSNPTTSTADHATVYVALREVAADKVLPRLLEASGSSTDASSYPTGALAPTGIWPIYGLIFNQQTASTAATPSLGAGWSVEATQVLSTTSRLSLVKGVGVSGVQTIDFGGTTQLRCVWTFSEYEHGGALVQSVTAAAGSATLSSFADAANAAIGGGFRNQIDMSAGQGWSPTGRVLVIDTTAFVVMSTWRPDGSDLGVDFVTSSITIAAEVEYVQAAVLGQVSETDVAQQLLYGKVVALDQVTETDTAQPLTADVAGPGHPIFVQDIASEMGIDIAAVTKRWFRNGIAPPAVPTRRLVDALNILAAQRMRVLFSKARCYGLHADFDSGSTADLTAWRFQAHTGPVTRKVRAKLLFLPLPAGAAISTEPYAEWVMTRVTGGGDTNQGHVVVPGFSASGSFDADELFSVEQEWSVEPDMTYRFALHLVNQVRPISGTVYEMPRGILDSEIDTAAVDGSGIYQGAPILSSQIRDMQESGRDAWRIGHKLFAWSHDLPANVLSRTTATLRNLLDQTVSAAGATSPGWPVHVPYSGTLNSSDVPVVMWAYAACPSGTGSIEFRDQDDNVIGTLAPAGAAGWYQAEGVLTDASGTPQTTRVEAYIAGDGTHALAVSALGMYMHAVTP